MPKALPASSASSKHVTRALSGMTDACREITQEIRDDYAKVAVSEIVAFWRIGQRINKVLEDESKFGVNAVEQIATALQLEANLFYSCRKFASAFTAAEVKELGARKNAAGVGLSFSHFVALSRVQDTEFRTKMLNKAYQHCLSVRDLVAQIQQQQGRRSNNLAGRAGAGPRSPTAAASSLGRALKKICADRPRLLELLDAYTDPEQLPELARDEEVSRLDDLAADAELTIGFLQQVQNTALAAAEKMRSQLQGDSEEPAEEAEIPELPVERKQAAAAAVRPAAAKRLRLVRGSSKVRASAT